MYEMKSRVLLTFNQEGNNVLHFAVENKDESLVSKLIEHYKPSCIHEKNNVFMYFKYLPSPTYHFDRMGFQLYTKQ
jgi:uncharacterized membrane protein YvbJ